uniref:Uncharacterized protein n=1 Tax=Oryza meridionalis TaxID=40149 RepID=A0A0E0CDI6_9ORYZ
MLTERSKLEICVKKGPLQASMASLALRVEAVWALMVWAEEAKKPSERMKEGNPPIPPRRESLHT